MHVSRKSPSFMPLSEMFLLLRYHLRVLNWWLFVLMLLGFLGAGALFWLQMGIGNQDEARRISVFVLEGGVGIIAGVLVSSLIIGDPVLELTIATRTGIGRVLAWRYLLTFAILFACSLAFLVWCLMQGVSYAEQKSWFSLLLVWLAPVVLMSMVSLCAVLKTRNPSLGVVIAIIPLMTELILHETLLDIPVTRPLFIPYSYWAWDAPDWLFNRLSLLGIALAFALWNCWLLWREEHLLDQRQ